MFYSEQHNINSPEVGRIFQFPDMFKQPENNLKIASQMPLMDLKNLQFSLEDRDYSKTN